MTARTPCLFLDRDGVVNHEVGYLHRQEDVRWVDGVFPLIATARELGYKVVIVTNQAGIGRALYTLDQFHELMDWMRAEFRHRGAEIQGVYFCGHHPDAVLPEYRGEHPDRKPNPGMILRAANDLVLDLRRSILVGDRCTDIAAANAARVGHAFLLAGTEEAPCRGSFIPVASLGEVEAWMREQS